MRFSAVQEDGYGVGLGQETPLNNVDENIMAATGDDAELGGNNDGEEGSMISNLPLLFANGYPTSLEKITLLELEQFITFMIQCSSGHDTEKASIEPPWWPKEIKFSNPFVRPKKINENYMGNLKKLVFRCYTYHRSEYLLRFCSYLAQYPHSNLEYVNNYDSTTSLFLKTTGKLLVTFRNENMNYDRKMITPRKQLLLNKARNYSNSTKNLRRRSAKQAPSPAMVEPPIEDIYLCDNCDAEFVGHHRMMEHEKLCYHVEPRPLTPEYEEVPEIQQNQFMEYFQLKSINDPVQENSTLGSSVQNRTSARIRGSVNLTRCPTIPFSSPAGLALAKKSKMMTEAIQQERLERIERHLCAPPLSSSFKPKWLTKTYEFDRWAVTYKPKCDKTTIKNEEYAHTFKFGNYSHKPVLDLRSQLLYIACKPIYVLLSRITDEQLEELKRDPSRYRSPERKIPRVRLRQSPVEPLYKPALGDKTNPIVIDLDDDDDDENKLIPPFISTPLLSTPVQSLSSIRQSVLTPPTPPSTISNLIQVSPIRLASTSRVSTLRCKKTSRLSPPVTTPATQTTIGVKRLRSSKPVILVSLCSSDEDEESNSCVSIDENCDPMQKQSASSATTTATMNNAATTNIDDSSFQSNAKLCAKSCIYPAKTSTNNWLSNLNTDGAPELRKDSLLKTALIFKNTM